LAPDGRLPLPSKEFARSVLPSSLLHAACPPALMTPGSSVAFQMPFPRISTRPPFPPFRRSLPKERPGVLPPPFLPTPAASSPPPRLARPFHLHSSRRCVTTSLFQPFLLPRSPARHAGSTIAPEIAAVSVGCALSRTGVNSFFRAVPLMASTSCCYCTFVPGIRPNVLCVAFFLLYW